MSFPISETRRLSEQFMGSALVITTSAKQVDENGNPLLDEYGYELDPIQTTQTTRYRLKGLSGEEQVIAGRLSSTVTASLICPHDTPLTSDMKVNVDGDDYSIVHVTPKSKNLKAHTKALVSRVS